MTIANKIEITAVFWGVLSGLATLVSWPWDEEDKRTHVNGFLLAFFSTCILILLGCAMWELWSAPTKGEVGKQPTQLEAK